MCQKTQFYSEGLLCHFFKSYTHPSLIPGITSPFVLCSNLSKLSFLFSSEWKHQGAVFNTQKIHSFLFSNVLGEGGRWHICGGQDNQMSVLDFQLFSDRVSSCLQATLPQASVDSPIQPSFLLQELGLKMVLPYPVLHVL